MHRYSTFLDGNHVMQKIPHSMNVNAIEVEGLEGGYDGKTVLENVSFSVKRGEIFFVIGGSGCGKSTLLRHMIGLHHPTAGSVKYFGEDFGAADPSRRRELLK